MTLMRSFSVQKLQTGFEAVKKTLTFMGPCIVRIVQYISNKMHSLYYLETALHAMGGTSTHNQERIQLYLQYLVFVTPLLLPAPIVVELGQLRHDSGS